MFNIPLLNIMLDKHFFQWKPTFLLCVILILELLHSYIVSFLYWNEECIISLWTKSIKEPNWHSKTEKYNILIHYIGLTPTEFRRRNDQRLKNKSKIIKTQAERKENNEIKQFSLKNVEVILNCLTYV